MSPYLLEINQDLSGLSFHSEDPDTEKLQLAFTEAASEFADSYTTANTCPNILLQVQKDHTQNQMLYSDLCNTVAKWHTKITG